MKQLLLMTTIILLAMPVFAEKKKVSLPKAVKKASVVPMDIQWETNDTEVPFSSDEARFGGTFRTYVIDYPQTFRLFGPNSSEGFSIWTRKSCLLFALVSLHPNTDRIIPMLATHWRVMPDQRTIFFKLDPEARWSDGEPVLADDYVFALKFLTSPEIKAPFYNKWYSENIVSVEKLDNLTIKVVGKRPSWRPLYDYNLFPIPKHATNLNENWVQDANWDRPVCPGPYRIADSRLGKIITFKRVPNWWGNKKKYLKNLYNYDSIEIRVIHDMRAAYEYFKKDQLSIYDVRDASLWANETNIPAVKKGWIFKKRVFTDAPQGLSGLAMNLNTPVFKDQSFRRALHHLFDFDKINEKVMFNSYTRLNSAFTGTEYAAKDLKLYTYDPAKARRLLKQAGYTKRGSDGILVKEDGIRASFTILLGQPPFEKHLSIYIEDLKREGIDARIRLVDGATWTRYLLSRTFEMVHINMGPSIYPDPWQFFHSSFKNEVNNNNFFGFGNPEADALIEIYQNSLDRAKRIEAMNKLDRIIREEAFYIPFWRAPYVRFLAWNRLGMPATVAMLRDRMVSDFDAFWYDPQKMKTLKEAMVKNRSLSLNLNVDFDPFNLMKNN